jgi:flagellar protein FlaG
MSIDALAAQITSSAPRRQDAPAVGMPAKAAPVPAPQQNAPPPPPTFDQVKAAAEQIQRYLESSGRSLNFRVDSDTGRVVISVRDAASGDLIRQIPSEEALQLARSLGESGASLLSAVA